MGAKQKNKIDVFNKIDANDKSYWLGFMGADGSNSVWTPKKGSTRYATRMQLSKKDEQHILNFRDFLGPQASSTNLYQVPPTINPKWGCLDGAKSQFLISGKMMSDDLTKNGCPPRKTLIYKFPTEEQVPNKFLNHTVRGYFDGDGSIMHQIGSNGYGLKLHSSVEILGTKSYIDTLERKLNDAHLNLKYSLRPEKRVKHDMLYYKVVEQPSVLRFLEWMYKDSTDKTRLHRKFKKSEKVMTEIRHQIKLLQDFADLEIIVRSPEGETFKVKEIDYSTFVRDTIKVSRAHGSSFRTQRLTHVGQGKGNSTAASSTNGDAVAAKNSKRAWTILNAEEVQKRRFPNLWRHRNDPAVMNYSLREN